MQIIKRGKVERGIFGTWWLVDGNGNSVSRLSGDWVEKYAGQELAIAAYDTWDKKEEEPFFEIAAKILNRAEKEMKRIDKRKTARLLEGAICRRDCDLWDSELDQCEDIESRAECLGITEAVIIALQKEEQHEVALSDPLHDQELEERD